MKESGKMKRERHKRVINKKTMMPVNDELVLSDGSVKAGDFKTPSEQLIFSAKKIAKKSLKKLNKLSQRKELDGVKKFSAKFFDKASLHLAVFSDRKELNIAKNFSLELIEKAFVEIDHAAEKLAEISFPLAGFNEEKIPL